MDAGTNAGPICAQALQGLPQTPFILDMHQHRVVLLARGAALQSLVSISNSFELTDEELASEALQVCSHVGLAAAEAGPLLVAFNSLSADDFAALASEAYPQAGEKVACAWL